jgi:hypothetical protein
MAVTVTLPVAAPTGLTATLQAGGSLAASTTYYFIVIAYDQAWYTPNNALLAYHSPISAEGTFTTDAVNRSVKINWNNVTGATRYQILLTTTSGNYTNSGGYGTTSEHVGSITSGVTGYTITALSTEVYVFHTCQIVNALPGNINKTLGLIQVDFSTAGNITLDQVYDAIVAAGFSDYVSYDGYNFILKGWFYASGSGAGTFNPTNKRFVFIKGGVANISSTYIIRFGAWYSDLVGASYANTCSIDILNARAPFWGYYGKVQAYGCLITNGQSFYQKLTENKTIGNFFFGTPFISFNISEMKDNILGMPTRDTNSIIKDCRLNHQNQFANEVHIRCKVVNMVLLPYCQGGKFYDCKWVTTAPFEFYNGSTWATSGYYTDFYDNEFTGYAGGIIGPNNTFRYAYIDAANRTSNQFVRINYSLTATVLDEAGNPLSGVTIAATDSSSNPVVFIEYDSTIDKLVTGNTFTGSVTTDANGQIGYYIKSYRIDLNPANTTYPTSYNIIRTEYYPFTITFSKAGYKDYTILLETLIKKTDMTLTLERTTPTITGVAIIDCSVPGANNGQIQITAESDYTLEYSINGTDYQAGNTITGLAPGTYTAYIRDSNGVVETMEGIEIIEPEETLPIITGIDIVNCSTVGGNEGSLTITVTSPNLPVMYSIDNINFQSENIFENLSAGYYSLYVKDSRDNYANIEGVLITDPSYVYLHTLPISAEVARQTITGLVTKHKIVATVRE